MNRELQDLAAWTIERAAEAGADASRVRITGERRVEIQFRDGKAQSIKEAATRTLAIEVYAAGRYSAQSTSDLRRDALGDFIARAVVTTKLLAEDPDRSLPDPRYYEGRAQLDLGVRDAAYEALSPEGRLDIARRLESACRERAGEPLISAEAEEADRRVESVVLTSNGFVGSREATYFTAGAMATVRDEDDRRPNGYYYVSSVSLKGMPSAEECGRLAAERTLEQIGGRKIATETLPVIIENSQVPRVLSGLLDAMDGSNIQQQRSFLAGKKGERIASEKLTLIDDPHVPGGLGSRLYDGDGFATRRRTMIEAGVLRDFYIDWYYGRKLGWEPTTGESTNLVIPPGTRSVAEIMQDLGRGILITGFIGGNSNSTTGDASVGILGRLFDGGVPVHAVAEMNIAANHLELWQKLIEVANDPWIYSSWRTPSLVLADVVVAGV